MNKIKYELHANKTCGGMLAIVVRCSQFEKVLDIDTDVRVFNDEWNQDDGLVVNSPNTKNLNALIRKTLYEIESYELNYDGEFTLSRLNNIWDCREASYDFYLLMAEKIKMRRDIRQGTKDIHMRVLVHLKKYQEDCMVSELTEEYVRGFILYMKEAGLCASTASMHIRALRSYYNIARRMYGNKVPAGTFDFYHEQAATRFIYKMKALDDNDIRLLENYSSNPSSLECDKLAIDRFLFMSYTGMRISDFCNMKKEDITNENGGMWINYVSVKTETPVRLPIFCMFGGRAEQLLNKYADRFDEFFFKSEHQKNFNECIQRAARRAGLTKHISAHVARHTCASRLVNKDVPVTTIQKIVGHRSLKMTMVYASTNENTLIRQLA